MSRWQKLISYVWGVMGWAAALLETGQTTAYSVFDDGDQEIGVDKAYTVIATPGNSLIEVAHYAAATISFTLAGSVVADAANGLATILTGDTVVIKGSALNDGVYTVAGGGVAAQFTTVEALVNEAAGAVVSIYKQTAHANIVVQDTKTGRMWSQTTSNGEKVGIVSDGRLFWGWGGVTFTLYSVANTISCIAPNIFRIIGGAALTQFHVGDMITCSGFANGVNNLPNYYLISATPNGADLDIVVDPGNQILIAEGAVADAISMNCQSIFNYVAGARAASLGGYTDWRIPNLFELFSLANLEQPTAVPDAVAFPGWPATTLWSTSNRADWTPNKVSAHFLRLDVTSYTPDNFFITALVRS